MVDSFQEVAQLTIDDGTTKQNFGLICESWELKLGDKDIESLPTVAGGRIVKFTPEKDTEATFKIIPLGAGTETETSMTGFLQRMHPQASAYNGMSIDNSDPVAIQNSRKRNTYKLAILLSNTTFPADATQQSVASAAAFRFGFQNAYITAAPVTFATSDGAMEEVTIKVPAFQKNGSSNIRIDSCDGTGAQIPVLTFV